MGERLHVASRKGLFTLARNGGWHIERVDFLGDNCSAVLSDARDGCLYAALDHGHAGCGIRIALRRGKGEPAVGFHKALFHAQAAFMQDRVQVTVDDRPGIKDGDLLATEQVGIRSWPGHHRWVGRD